MHVTLSRLIIIHTTTTTTTFRHWPLLYRRDDDDLSSYFFFYVSLLLYYYIIILLLSVYISAAFFMLRRIFVIYYVSVSAFAEHKFHRNDYNMDITVKDRFCWTYWLVCIFVSISQEEYWSRTGQLVFHSDQTRVEDIFFDFIGSRQTGRESIHAQDAWNCQYDGHTSSKSAL